MLSVCVSRRSKMNTPTAAWFFELHTAFCPSGICCLAAAMHLRDVAYRPHQPCNDDILSFLVRVCGVNGAASRMSYSIGGQGR